VTIDAVRNYGIIIIIIIIIIVVVVVVVFVINSERENETTKNEQIKPCASSAEGASPAGGDRRVRRAVSRERSVQRQRLR